MATRTKECPTCKADADRVALCTFWCFECGTVQLKTSLMGWRILTPARLKGKEHR